jgi:hypothetical protein
MQAMISGVPMLYGRPPGGAPLAIEPLHRTEQAGYVASGLRAPIRLPGPVAEVGAGDLGTWVLGAKHPLAGSHQLGRLVTGQGLIARLPGPEGEVAADL